MSQTNVKIRDVDFHAFLSLAFTAKRTPLVRSAPGTGKSKGLEAYARAMNEKHRDDGGYGFFLLDMSKANIADLNGFLMPEKESFVDIDGKPREIMAGKYTYPFFLYDLFTGRPAHTFRHGVIVFEEWGQGDAEVKKAAAPMIYDRRLGLWQFPEFDVVMLSNRAEDRSGVTKEYDFIINRIIVVTLVPTLEHFLVIGHQLGMTNLTLAFAARNEETLFNDPVVPKEQGPWLTLRSLHAVDDIVKAAEALGMDLKDPIVTTGISGTIGFAEANKYIAFIDARTQIPTVREVLSDPVGCRIPAGLDVLTFLVFDLASKTKRDNVDAIAAYIKRMSDGMGVAYFNAVSRRDPTMVSTAAFSSFAKSNITLLSAVAMRRA